MTDSTKNSPVTQFDRIELLLGTDKLERLKSAFVVVVGLGAVGSYAVEALARAGIGKMRLVDFDEIRISNINRQLCALHSTLGQHKTDVVSRRVFDINPSCNVELLNVFFSRQTANQILDGEPDLVIDAIDSLNPKTTLIEECVKRELKIISSMGAARRREPSFIRFGMLRDVNTCPLARFVRKRLRKRDVSLDIPCVYSVEPDQNKALGSVPSPEADDSNYVKRGRERQPIGSMPTITGIFGLIVAHEAIRMITQSNDSVV